jgi:ATP-dependent DNA helicase RecG
MDMTAAELQAWLLKNFPRENEKHEWKGWGSLKGNISGQAGEDLLSYVSAFANMEGGCVVIGAVDKTLLPVGIRDVADYTPENLPHRLLGNCVNLPSLGLLVDEHVATDSGARVWVVHVPRHTPRLPVYAHRKAWQRDGDSLTELRDDRKQAILSELLAAEDWSAAVVSAARVEDLDREALNLARTNYAKKMQLERWASEIPSWTDLKFLDKVGLATNGAITRAALLLLGDSLRAQHLLQHPAEISWKVPDERVIEHFAPPFLLTTTAVLQRIRNPSIKLFPASQLIATELPRYDVRVVLEALHNCIAHQDYARGSRIVLEEVGSQLKFINAGSFVDGEPVDYVDGARTPVTYRNRWLASAMSRVGMIDKAGFGIKDMFGKQRERYLPLPDYDESSLNETVFKVYGHAIDENYSRLLMERSDLSTEQVVWLDRVQKKLPIGSVEAAKLRRAGLIDGRKPNLFVSLDVANLTDRRAEYTRLRGLGDMHFKQLVVQHLKNFKEATGTELRKVIFDKLPDVLTPQQRQNKATNLLSAIRMKGVDGFIIVAARREKGQHFWRLEKKAKADL